MARRERKPSPADWLAQPAPVKADDGKLTDRVAGDISTFQSQVVSKLNGGISFGEGVQSSWSGNIDGQIVEWTFTAADTEYPIPHGLGRVPWGVLPAALDRAGVVYYSNRGGWGKDLIYLKSSVAGLVAQLIVI